MLSQKQLLATLRTWLDKLRSVFCSRFGSARCNIRKLYLIKSSGQVLSLEAALLSLLNAIENCGTCYEISLHHSLFIFPSLTSVSLLK